MKVCTKCGDEKPLADFPRFQRARDGRSPSCRVCRNAQSKEYRERNRERLSEAKRARYRANPARVRASHERWKASNPERHRFLQRRSHLKTVYGMTVEDYDALLSLQGGSCAVCDTAPPEGKRLHVDHDHACCPGERSCGQCVRGLLCGPCNRLLGWVERRRETIDRYLGAGVVS